MTTEKSNQQYMTFEEMVEFLLGNPNNGTYCSDELGRAYLVLADHEYDKADRIMSDRRYRTDEYVDKLRSLSEQIKHAISDTNNPKAKEFLDYATIAVGTRLAYYYMPSSLERSISFVQPKPIDALHIFLKNIENIKSDKVKYASLHLLSTNRKGFDKKLIHQILIKIAENPLATTSDLYDLQKSYPENDPTSKKIFAEIEAKTQRLIEEETKKILPDARKIRQAIAVLNASAQYIGDSTFESRTQNMYDIEKILNPESGKEYVAKIEESKMEKIAKLEAEVAEQNKKLQIADRQLKETQEGWRQTTEALKQLQIEKEAQESQKEELAGKLEKSKKRTQRLIEATEQLQIGIGSRGIKKMRETVEQIEHEMRKIER